MGVQLDCPCISFMRQTRRSGPHDVLGTCKASKYMREVMKLINNNKGGGNIMPGEAYTLPPSFVVAGRQAGDTSCSHFGAKLKKERYLMGKACVCTVADRHSYMCQQGAEVSSPSAAKVLTTASLRRHASSSHVWPVSPILFSSACLLVSRLSSCITFTAMPANAASRLLLHSAKCLSQARRNLSQLVPNYFAQHQRPYSGAGW